MSLRASAINSIVVSVVCALLTLAVRADDAATRASVGPGDTKVEADATELDAFDAVTGLVVDSEGRPVPGAAVILRTQYSGVSSGSNEPARAADLARARTDVNGRFDFRGVRVPTDDIIMRRDEPGLHWLDIVVSAPGFALGWSHIVLPEMRNIVLRPEARLQGRIVDMSQSPVADAEVRVRHLMSIRQISQLDLELKLSPQSWPANEDPRFISLADSHLPECTAKTDADGRFEVRGLPDRAGIILEVDHPDFQIERVYAATIDRIDPAVRENSKRNVQVGKIQASLKRGHHVAVNVVFDDTGKPAAHTKFPLLPLVYPPQGTADERGRFEYRHIANREFYFRVSAPDGTYYLDASQTLDLNDDTFDHEVTVRLMRGVPVTGRVVDVRTERGVPEVHVIGAVETPPPAQKSLAPVPYGTTTTDKDGAFRMVVPPGAGIVAIWNIDPRSGIYRPVLPDHVDYRDVDPSLRKEVSFDPQKAPKSIVFELASLPPLRGTITDDGGKPAPRAKILGTIQQGENSFLPFQRQSGTDGTFELPDLFHVNADVKLLPAKVLVLDRIRNLGNIIDIDPRAPTDEPIDFELVPLQTVRGRTLDSATGKPIEFAKVRLTGETHRPEPTVRTDSKGMFSITALVPKVRYSIRIEAPGYISFSDKRTRFVAATEDHDVGDLDLRPVPNPEQ